MWVHLAERKLREIEHHAILYLLVNDDALLSGSSRGRENGAETGT